MGNDNKRRVEWLNTHEAPPVWEELRYEDIEAGDIIRAFDGDELVPFLESGATISVVIDVVDGVPQLAENIEALDMFNLIFQREDYEDD